MVDQAKKETKKVMKEATEKDKTKTKPTAVPTHFNFDKAFQEKIVQAMIMDRMWAGQFQEVLQVDYFELAHLKLIAGKYLEYNKKYKEFPSKDLLMTIIKNELKNKSDAGLQGTVKDFFIRVEMKKDLCDLVFVKEKALDFCKKAALQSALEQSVDFIETEKYDKVVDVIKKALSAGNEHTEGLVLSDDIDSRYSETYRTTTPTGIPELDQRKILNGGLGAGEIGIVVAPAGVGKSHLLVDFGAAAVKAGKNVIHYTFELNERMTGIRYDSNLTGIPSLNCYDEKENIKEFYKTRRKELGKLVIKYYPTGMATAQTLRTHVEKLNMKGFVPDLILVDYAGIMRSSERYELLRLELKKVCEDLRSMAEDLDIPIWTALQSNKEGASAEIIDLTNMAESYAQAAIADFVLGLSRQSIEKSTGYGTLFIAKNRAGIDGIKYPCHLDTSRSKLRVITDAESAESRDKTDEQRQEAALAFVRTKVRNQRR